MNRNFLLILSMISLIFTGQAFAHAMLEKSSPANAAVLTVAPKVLDLKFGHPTKLTKLKLIQLDQENKEIPITLNLSAPASATFSIPLPALQAGKYEAKWTTLSNDGHAMSGALSFSITGR